MATSLPPQVPPVPVVVVAAASAPVATPVAAPVALRGCTRMEGGTGGLLPMVELSNYLYRHTGRQGPSLVGAELRVLQAPAHGELLPDPEPSTRGPSFVYRATDAAWLGVDRVGFEVLYAGRSYRIVQRIEMVPYVDQDERTGAPYRGTCDARLRRVSERNANPVTPAFTSWAATLGPQPAFPRLRGGASPAASLGSRGWTQVTSQGAQRWW